MEIPDVEFPRGYSVVQIKDVPNEEIWPCYYETFMSSGDGRFLDQNDTQRKENFEKFFDKSRPRSEEASILVRKGQRIIGYNQVIITEEGGFFNGIGIHPDFRRKGLGKMMILTSMKRAAENGVSKLILEVDIENKVAIDLYEKVGFKQTKGSISHVWKRIE
jgi:ribosomal protein S18 acetylase RimI-like enzyme